MKELKKTCKKHGELNINDIYVKSNNKGLECKICKRESRKKAFKNSLKRFKDLGLDKNPKFNCINHGELDAEDIFIRTSRGTLGCKICKNIGTEKLKVKYRSDLIKRETMNCGEHGILNRNQFHLSKNGVATCRECSYYRRVLYTFKLTKEKYDSLILEQDNKCKICKMPETKKQSKTGELHRLAIDHCHTSGKVRGLLCSKCNTMIGLSKENPATLRAGADYLEL